MATVTEYQQALRERSEADELWSNLIIRLKRTADHFAKGNPETFNMKPNHDELIAKGRASSILNIPMRYEEWPSSDQLSVLAKRVSEARQTVKSTWSALPEADKIGLKDPERY